MEMTRETIPDDPTATEAAAAYRPDNARMLESQSDQQAQPKSTQPQSTKWQFVYSVGFAFAIVQCRWPKASCLRDCSALRGVANMRLPFYTRNC